MEPNGSVLTTNVFLDRFGEVVLRLDPDGLSWEPIESKVRCVAKFATFF